jgi:hypothetical protein
MYFRFLRSFIVFFTSKLFNLSIWLTLATSKFMNGIFFLKCSKSEKLSKASPWINSISEYNSNECNCKGVADNSSKASVERLKFLAKS